MILTFFVHLSVPNGGGQIIFKHFKFTSNYYWCIYIRVYIKFNHLLRFIRTIFRINWVGKTIKAECIKDFLKLSLVKLIRQHLKSKVDQIIG